MESWACLSNRTQAAPGASAALLGSLERPSPRTLETLVDEGQAPRLFSAQVLRAGRKPSQDQREANSEHTRWRRCWSSCRALSPRAPTRLPRRPWGSGRRGHQLTASLGRRTGRAATRSHPLCAGMTRALMQATKAFSSASDHPGGPDLTNGHPVTGLLCPRLDSNLGKSRMWPCSHSTGVLGWAGPPPINSMFPSGTFAGVFPYLSCDAFALWLWYAHQFTLRRSFSTFFSPCYIFEK